MRQQEAEQEAARRNAEDERRDRFVFYALDHSAGMSEGAWEVEMRLRTDLEGPEPSAVPVGAGASEAAAEPVAEPSEAEDPLPDTRAFAPVEAAEAVEPLPPSEPEPHEPEPLEPEPLAPEPLEPVPVRVEPAAAVRATDVDVPLPAPPRRRRRPRLIQVWGVFVILVGLLFVAATLLLSVGLRDYTHFGALPTAIGVGLGLLAVGIGVALVRTA